jgi:hypothetical protein
MAAANAGSDLIFFFAVIISREDYYRSRNGVTHTYRSNTVKIWEASIAVYYLSGPAERGAEVVHVHRMDGNYVLQITEPSSLRAPGIFLARQSTTKHDKARQRFSL